jgi:O-antigen ligase
MSMSIPPLLAEPGVESRGAPLAETAAVVILCVAAVVAPVCLGATGPLARSTLEVAMAVAAMLWAASACRRLSVVAVPLLLAAAVALQLLPLPDRVLMAIAPVSAGAWKVAHEGMPEAFGQISVDPSTTAVAMMRLVIATTIVCLVADVARRPVARTALVASLAICAAVAWGLGLAFPFKRTELVLLGFIDFRGPIEAEFWRTPLVPALQTNGSGVLDTIVVAGQRYRSPAWVAADGFGSFIYSNHFASAMCMTVPALVAGWLALTKDRLPWIVRSAVAAVVFAGAFWTVGVLATSRAGAGAMLMAGLVFLALAVRSPIARRGAWALAALYAALLLAFVVVFYGRVTGYEALVPENLRPRLAALLADSRSLSAQAALRMFSASPVLGIGLSCFGAFVPRFVAGDMLLYYAHNDYAQLLAETGLVGLTVVVAGVVLFARRFIAMRRTQSSSGEGMLEAAAWAAIAGVAVHSAFDWNMHVPANALLACIVAGVALATGDRAAPGTRSALGTRAPRLLAGTMAQAALVLALGVAIAMVVRDACAETAKRGLREAITADRLAAIDPKRTSAKAALAAATEAAERMASWDPANADLALLTGQAYLHRMALPQPMDEADEMQRKADEWLRRARRHSAALAGMPEPVLGR